MVEENINKKLIELRDHLGDGNLECAKTSVQEIEEEVNNYLIINHLNKILEENIQNRRKFETLDNYIDGLLEEKEEIEKINSEMKETTKKILEDVEKLSKEAKKNLTK